MRDSNFSGSNRIFLLMFFLALSGWNTSSFAKSPFLVDTLDLAAQQRGGIIPLEGQEWLNLSQCCKLPKTDIVFSLSIPEPGKWEITEINGEPLVNEVPELDPITGTYKQRNSKQFDLKFDNKTEEDQFTARLEEIATAAGVEAGTVVEPETVELSYNKYKLNIQVKYLEEGSQLKFRADFKLRRDGLPNLGSGVYKIQANEMAEPII